jgi:hypothetical protein
MSDLIIAYGRLRFSLINGNAKLIETAVILTFRQPTQANGRMFWFMRKKFFESYFVFTSWSRR